MPDHFSVSQLDMFTRCGEQYRRRYIEGEVITPGISARIGSGVHKAAETNWREKMRTGSDMPMDSVLDGAGDAYDKYLREGVFFAPDELAGARNAMREGKDAAISLARVFRAELASKIQPALVEEKIILELPGAPLPIITILDLYTQDGSLRDLKTSGKKWPEGKAHSSNQPTAYREAVKLATGEYPARLCFDVLAGGENPCLQTLETTRNEDDAAILARKFGIMARAIEAGVFQPAEPGSWVCRPKYCGYWFTCPHIPARRKILPKRSA